MRRSGWAVGLGERVSLWLLMRVLLCVIICSFAFYAFPACKRFSRGLCVFSHPPRRGGGGLVLCSSFAKMEEGDEEEEEEEAGRRKQEG